MTSDHRINTHFHKSQQTHKCPHECVCVCVCVCMCVTGVGFEDPLGLSLCRHRVKSAAKYWGRNKMIADGSVSTWDSADISVTAGIPQNLAT